MTDWNEHEDAIDDVISDSIDMDWTSRTGAKAVVAWLNENAAAPAPSSLAGGEITNEQIQSVMLAAIKEVRATVTDATEGACMDADIIRMERGLVDMGVAGWAVMRAVHQRLAALSPEAPARDGAETGWLIEGYDSKRGAFKAQWWGLHADLDEDGQGWTTDSLKALRFSREADAQAYIDNVGWTEAKPTDHQWSDTSALTPRHEAPASEDAS